MPTMRTSTRLAVGSLALVAALAGCSDSDGAAPTTTQPLTFQTVPAEATRLGVCRAFTIDAMQSLVGEAVTASLPSTITEDDGAVTGEACSWELKGADDAGRSVRIEARDFDGDVPAAEARFEELRQATTGAADLPGVGDAAFSAGTDDTALVQIRTGAYLLTASSRGTGDLDPVGTAELGVMLATTIDKLP